MRNIIIAVVAILALTGCKSIPKFPEKLEKYHIILIPQMPLSGDIDSFVVNSDVIPRSVNKLTCLEFKIVQMNPIQVEFLSETEIINCHELAGYQPQEQVELFNWIDDVYRKFGPKQKEESDQ